MSDPIYKHATTIGDGKSPVVIDTSGKVVVKVREKYFPLNFQESSEDLSSSSSSEDNFFPIQVIPAEDIQESLSALTEDTLILSPEGQINLYYSDTLFPLGQLSIPDMLTLSNVVITKNLKVASKELVANLNANYLEGKTAKEFVSATSDQTIKFPWKFEKAIEFVKLAGDNIYLNDLDGSIRAKSLLVDKINIDYDYDLEGNKITYEPNTIYLGKGTIIEYVEEGDLYYEAESPYKTIRVSLKEVSKFELGDVMNYAGVDHAEYIGEVIDVIEANNIAILKVNIDAQLPLIGTVIYSPNKTSFVGDIGELHLMRDHSVRLGDAVIINSEGESTYLSPSTTRSSDLEETTTNIITEIKILQRAVLSLQNQIDELKKYH